MLTPEEEDSLVRGGYCYLHQHEDRYLATHDELQRLQELESLREVTSSAAITMDDDIILVDSTGGAFTLSLPASRGGKRYTFTRVGGAGNITITPQSPDTINGASSLVISSSYTPVRLKSVNGRGWVTL